MRKMKALCIAAAFLFESCACFAACGETPSPTPTPNPPVGSGEEPFEWTIPEGSWSHSKKIKYVRDMGFATGDQAFTDTTKYNMTGTDLGFAFYDPDIKRLYAAFGDTNDMSTGVNQWNSNVVLYTDHLDLSEGIKWDGALSGQNGATRTVTPLTKKSVNQNTERGFWQNATVGDVTCDKVSTCIPTGAIVLNGVYYMWYMEVGAFLDSGEWDVYRNCTVKSTDKGATWTKVEGLEWICKDAEEKEGIAPNFGQIYPLDGNDGYLYLYGIPGGRRGGVKLGRVKYENIEDFESYEYFKSGKEDGSAEWSKGTNGLESIKTDVKSYVVMPMCGELSVHWNEYMNRFCMTYMQNNSQIVMRRSTTPWGEWSSSDAIVTQGDVPSLYGGLSHAAMTDHDGQRMYLFVSVWHPTYNVKLLEVVLN